MMLKLNSNKKRGHFFLAGGIYFTVFSLLFLQFPLHKSISGNIDTWYYIATFNDYYNHLIAFFTGEVIGHNCYPEGGFYKFGEPSFGGALVFLFFKLCGLNDLWAYYGLDVLIYTANAFGVFLLAGHYLGKKDFNLNLITGIIFAASSYLLANIDQQSTIIFFPALFSIFFYKKFLATSILKYLIIAFGVGGLQVYFSGNLFFLQCLVLGILTLIHAKVILEKKPLWQPILIALLLPILIIQPFAWMYIFNDALSQNYNPSSAVKAGEIASLDLIDFTRSLPGNFIYAPLQDIDFPLLYGFRAANLGVAVFFFAIIGFCQKFKGKVELTIILLLSLTFAFGSSVHVGSILIPLPAQFLYESLDFYNLVRVPAKAFIVCTLCFSIFAVIGLKQVQSLVPKYATIIGLGFLIIFVLENIPFPMQQYQVGNHMTPPELYGSFFEGKKEEVIANLPSKILVSDTNWEETINEYTREYIYMLWQTYHKNHIINGSGGFFPDSRLQNNDWMKHITEGDNLKHLIKANNLSFLTYFPKMKLEAEDINDLDYLKSSPLLTLVAEEESVIIFEVNKERQENKFTN